MTFTAVGPLTYSLLGLRTILAESADFQAFVGAADQTQAEAKVHFFDYEDDPDSVAADLPNATIWIADRFAMEMIAGGDMNYLDPGGDLALLICGPDEDAADRDQGYWNFLVWMDKIIKTLRDSAAVNDHLTITAIRFRQSPVRSPRGDDPTTGGYWLCGLIVSWGQGGKA